MLLDDYNSKLPVEMLAFLNNSDIEIRFYNMLNLSNIFRIDRRMHDKYIVVDREHLLVGGRNLKDSYFKLKAKETQTFYDLDILLRGEAAIEAADYFEERWNSHLAQVKKFSRFDEDKYIELEEKIFRTYEEIEAVDGISIQKNAAELEECLDTSFYAFDPNHQIKTESIEDIYVQEINAAQSSIDIQNAYVIFTKPIKKAIQAAASRGVKIRFITNSLKSSDVTLSYSAFRNLRPKLIKWGVEVFEFNELDTLHSKVAVFDNKRFIVGSFNLDPRSARLNSETIILSGDEDHTALISHFFESTLEFSIKIGKNGKPEGAERYNPGASFGKRLLNSVLRFTLAPILRGRL